MERDPLEIIRKNDPAMYESITAGRKLVYNDGVIPTKYKLLIALALDASLGSEAGVKSLAGQAVKAGAVKEEIMEAIRVAYFITGVGSVYTAARGLDGII